MNGLFSFFLIKCLRSVFVSLMPLPESFRLSMMASWTAIALTALPVWAQLELTPDTAPDRSLGTQVLQNALPNGDVIMGGTRSLNGQHLFHSFQEFNVRDNRGVYFQNPIGVQNILTRVTGRDPSDILGTLGVLGNANLFFLNPNGIFFGPNARLQINGSFVASTASSFRFPDGSEFSANNSLAPPLLMVNITPGLQTGTISPGSTITNRGNLTTGQDLILESDRLDLQGQLVAGRNLILKAQDTVQIRDSATTSLVASSGANLTVQGNTVDIFTLNHPNSGFWSGRNLVLQSPNPVVGDAHFFAGGNFQVEQLDGRAGDLLSPHDPIILTNGDVRLGNYQGASLHILAGGSVTLEGNITIISPGTADTTINPSNTTLFNGSRRYADLASVNLTNYEPILNRDRTVQSVNPVSVSIPINGSTQATLDVRAGIDWATLGGLPPNPVTISSPEFTTTEPPANANITVNGNIQINQAAGLVLLTNQYNPNTLPGTIAIQGDVNTSTTVPGANGGNIQIYGRGDITIASPNPPNKIFVIASSGPAGNGGAITFATNSGSIILVNADPISNSLSNLGNAGNGGAISFATNVGNINFTNSNSFSDSRTNSFSGRAGDGGTISFTTNFGNINLDNSASDSYSRSSSNFISLGNAGNGGAISFVTNVGNITSNSRSDSSSGSGSTFFSFGNAGNGGTISFATNVGNISLTDLSSSSSYSYAILGNAGNGGAISFATNSGNINLTNSDSFSDSRSLGRAGNGGTISFKTVNSGNISLTNSDSTSRSISLSNSAGNGGFISFATNSGNIELTNSASNSYSASNSGTAGNGGAISFTTTVGNITFKGTAPNTPTTLNSYSASATGDAGNGGAIFVSARRGIIAGADSTLNSFAVSQTERSGNGGRVTLEAGSGIAGLTIRTVSSGDNSGDVQINGFGNLLIDFTNILTAQQIAQSVEVELCLVPPCSSPNNLPLDTVFNLTLDISARGQAGNVAVSSIGNLTFSNSLIQSDTRGGNPAGNITINSPGMVSFNNSQIISNTRSGGQAGSIAVNAGEGITLTNASSLSATSGNAGTAGNITLNAPILTVAGNAQVFAETTGSGKGGTIAANALTRIDLLRVEDASPILSVETSGAGQAGNIILNTPTLTLSDKARITATATRTATNLEDSGSITLNASSLNLAGIVGVFAETQGQAPAGTLTLNPYLNELDLNIALTRNSQISASTSGSGNGGDLIVAAPQSITVTGPGKLAVETSGTGNAGNMIFTTRQLTLAGGVELSASTTGTGNAGDIGINAEALTLSGGATVSTNTFSSGAAGNLTIQVNDTLFLTGRGTGLFASTTPGSTGNGGNIIIDPRLVQIENGATIAVDSQGSGTGGSISLRAGRLELRDRASITAETASAQGGNITLDVQDLILLRRGSLISATAGTAQSDGDGGNITIRAPFIIGVLRENSDITANAFAGRGGNIAITTNAIFGLLPQARLTPLSDITASSEFGLSGTIAITDLNVDPNRGLVALPTNLTDTSRQVREACAPGSAAIARKNSFVVVGRGGLPASPEAAQTGDRPLVDLVSVVPPSSSSANVPSESSTHAQDEPLAVKPDAIVEAQGWTIARDGTVFLSAHNYVDSASPAGIPLPTCISR